MRYFLFGLIVPSLLFIAGCSKHTNDDNITDTNHLSVAKHRQTNFDLTDIDNRVAKLTYKDKQLSISQVTQHTIVVHIFSTQTDLCRAMLPYLSDLQHNQAKEIFVLGIVVPEQIKNPKLRSFMNQNGATFFISNAPDNAELAYALADTLQLGTNYPLPLTIVFYKGRYVTHYEGVTPIEMIYSDLSTINPTPKGTTK
jgi:thiol-disulfide isomerase/thioredoxin